MSDPRPSYRSVVTAAEADPHRYVTVERTGAIAVVRMDDAPTRYALSAALTVKLLRALRVALPAHAVTMTKPLLRAVSDMTWHQAITLEEMAEPMCFTTRGHREGVRATLDRLHRR